jgi:hypothetical protein
LEETMVKTSHIAPSRIAPAVLAMVALPLISGCNATGPSSIASGRALYNDVITRNRRRAGARHDRQAPLRRDLRHASTWPA